MTHVVVIGGGVTGCGIARDLAMRGAAVTLLERDRLNAGTSSRSHNMLHSGARYADVDPPAAVACKNESAILKEIGGVAIDKTNGVFVTDAEEEREYIDEKISACQSVGIQVEDVVDDTEFRKINPSITEAIEGAFRVSDGVIRPDSLVAATIHSAVNHGVKVRCDAEVTDIRIRNHTATDVVISDSGSRNEVLPTDFIINAAGPWAGEVATFAGGTVEMALTRGTIIEFTHSGIQEVINWCRPPSDGDILVPIDGGILAGTTSIPVESPGDIESTENEIDTIIQEATRVVPEFSTEQYSQVYSGIRPMYGGSNRLGGRESSRAYQLIDHADTDGIQQLVSVVGGKFTTHRLIAEKVGDHVAERTPIANECLTAVNKLPGAADRSKLDEITAKYF